ncbi:MAG: hypothetical protein J6W67_09280 [Lentisphaeria bacterium]|nr:hypothetical protein [Lentisphaeria bacterium]
MICDRRQSGQAMIELALMLLLMTFATLGMLMVCGMADFADETLLDARHIAEVRSKNTSVNETGSEYSTWQNNTYDEPYSGMSIPFNMDEKPVKGTNSIGTFGENLSDAGKSVPVDGSAYAKYKKLNKYHRLNDFDNTSFEHDFFDRSNSENMFHAANLVRARSDNTSNNPLSRVLSRDGHRKAAHISNSENEAYNDLLKAFIRLFGVDLEEAGHKIKNAPSSAVFMPSTDNTTEKE